MTGPDRTVPRFLVVALGIPAVITVVAVVLQLAALPQLPDPVAIHWGVGGSPDGFAPAWVMILTVALTGLGLPALIAITVLPGLRRGERGPSYRLMGATAAGVSTLMGVIGVATFWMQAGVTDAADASGIELPMLVAFLAAAAVGLLAWFVQPAQRATEPDASGAGALPLSDTERAAWMRTTSMPAGAVAAILGAVILVAVFAAVTWILGDPVAAWALTAVTLLLAALLVTTVVFRVRVDASGLTVASIAGLPRSHVDLADIESVAVVHVNPMAEFGGWGIRLAPGRFGYVLRSGPAIEVRRPGRSALVVTVDDAETGAALLRTLSERSTARG